MFFIGLCSLWVKFTLGHPQSQAKFVAKRTRTQSASLCAVHVRQFEGESPLFNLMGGEGLAKRKGVGEASLHYCLGLAETTG